jgi:MFS family permease
MPESPVRRRAEHGLDWFTGLAAAMQTGFGAFVPLYLASAAWGQAGIGLVLSAQTVALMAFQVPGGALVDASHRRRCLLTGAIGAIGLAAALLAVLPWPVPVTLALIVQAAAAAVLTPSIAALSLALVGKPALGERLGRNARFASIGSALAAGAMGGGALLLGQRAVFILAALLAIPARWALRHSAPRPRHGERDVVARPPKAQDSPLALLRDRRVLAFAACVAMFNIASAAILAVAAPELTRISGARAGLVFAVFIIVPQGVVALLSPWVGRLAGRIGRKPLLLAGWASLPVRAALFALLIGHPLALVPVQLLEGVAAATFGVLVPLVAADLTHNTGRYNLSLGLFGLCGAGGAALSTTLAGAIAELWGRTAAFGSLTALGLAATLLLVAMPETRDQAAGRSAG